MTVVQRVGYLVEFMAGEVDLDALSALVAHAEFSPLDTARSVAGDEVSRDDRWRVRRNVRIEHDL